MLAIAVATNYFASVRPHSSRSRLTVDLPPRPTPGLLSDDSRDGTSLQPDLLARGQFVTHINRTLNTLRTQTESGVLGLIGDWGSGKSTVVELLKSDLDTRSNNQEWIVAEFNPWTYSDLESTQLGFFAEIISALPGTSKWSKTRQSIGTLAQAVSPLGKLTSLVGFDSQPIISGFGSILQGKRSTSKARHAAEKALRDAGTPILVVVDDLDRLAPDELLTVLKLVRLIGRLPNLYFLLCYDERTLLDTLSRTPLVGEDKETRARAYLEKIVQVRLDLPALRESQRTHLLNTGLKVIQNCGLVLLEEDERRLGEAYYSALDARLSSPRSINRLLGQIQVSYPALDGEVDFVDFFLVTWIRTYEPGLYRFIRGNKELFVGGSLRLEHLFGDKDTSEQKSEWRESLKKHRVDQDDIDGVIVVLCALFPYLETIFEKAPDSAKRREAGATRGVANADYFDRYFLLGIPDDDLSDRAVLSALEAIASHRDTSDTTLLGEQIQMAPLRTISKVRKFIENNPSLGSPDLFRLLRSFHPNAVTSDGFFGNPKAQLVFAARDTLLLQDLEQQLALISESTYTRDGLSFAFAVVRRVFDGTSSASTSHSSARRDEFDKIVTGAIKRRLIECESRAAVDLFLFHEWRRIEPAQACDWLRRQVELGRWNLRDVIAGLVSTAIVSDSQGEHSAVGDFDIDSAVATFGIDHLVADLGPDIDSSATDLDSWSMSPSAENRLAYALSQLRTRRDSADFESNGEGA